MKKLLFLVIVLGLAGLIGWKVYQELTTVKKQGGRRRGGKKDLQVAVETAPVRKAPIIDYGEFTGSLKPESEFKIAPKIAGLLENINVDIGDWVKNDQLIAELDSLEQQHQVEQVRTELKIAESKLATIEALWPKSIAKAKVDISRWEATVNLTRKELERLEKLRKKFVTSEAEKDRAQEQLLVAQAQLMAAHKEYELAQVKYKEEKREAEVQIENAKARLGSEQVRLSYTKIKTIWNESGERRIIGERFVDEGTYLSAGTPIVSVLDIDSLTAVIYVTEKDYSKMKTGQTVTISTDAYPGQTFTGKITRIAPVLKETSREARVEIDVPNAKHLLKPGMFARAEIQFSKHDQATVIPRTALVKRKGKNCVFLVNQEDSTVRLVPVEIGITDENNIEILKPTLKGSVVTLGHHLLSNGSKVLLPSAKTETAGTSGSTTPQAKKNDKKE